MQHFLPELAFPLPLMYLFLFPPHRYRDKCTLITYKRRNAWLQRLLVCTRTKYTRTKYTRTNIHFVPRTKKKKVVVAVHVEQWNRKIEFGKNTLESKFISKNGASSIGRV